MLTADNITDDQIREYVRDHWRDPFMGGGPGKGCVNDAAAIALAKGDPHPSFTRRTRGEFAELINARAKEAMSVVTRVCTAGVLQPPVKIPTKGLPKGSRR